MEIDSKLPAVAASQPYPLLFVTISGAHLYGFPSPDSDYDLRGAHVLKYDDLAGLAPLQETQEIGLDIPPAGERGAAGELEIDLVTHDVRKYFRMILKPNGYVLEQVFSPLVLISTPEHEELRAAAQNFVTSKHARHYLGFADTQWRLVERER